MFLFTDAGAKDQNLKNTVIALIERTQTVVSSQTVVAPSPPRLCCCLVTRLAFPSLGELHDFWHDGGQSQETAEREDIRLGSPGVQGGGPGVGGSGHRGGNKRSGHGHQEHHAAVVQRVSGNLTDELRSGSLLYRASAVTSDPLQVTLLQAVRDPGAEANFTFAVDGTVTNLTVYITGQSVSYTVTSPSGEGAIVTVRAPW